MESGLVFAISRNDTRDFAIVYANPRNYGGVCERSSNAMNGFSCVVTNG